MERSVNQMLLTKMESLLYILLHSKFMNFSVPYYYSSLSVPVVFTAAWIHLDYLEKQNIILNTEREMHTRRLTIYAHAH